jgi:glutathione synthase/RimK-type ligase-like ATP-grasp enzyme
MKQLKIAICAQLESQTITEQLAPRLRARGHIVDILDLSSTSINNFIEQPEIQALLQYDILYYRSGLDDIVTEPDRLTMLESFLDKTSVKKVNLHFTKHRQAHSKIYEMQQAEKAGLLVPKSVFVPDVNFQDVSTEINLPFITKTDIGSNGRGVYLIRSVEDFNHTKEAHPDSKLLHQEFIDHDFEYRVYMIAGKVILTIKQTPPEGEFRSNEAQGGKTLPAESIHTNELTKLAKTAFETFGFEIMVVDFMFEKHTKQFYFTEINLNPGWYKSDFDITGVDAINLMANFFEKISG